MKQYSIIASLIAVSVIGVIYFIRVYPVALVNGSPVWYRTWERTLGATVHILAVQARANSTPFTPDAPLISLVRKQTLFSLIEDKIIVTQGRTLMPQFNTRAEMRITQAMSASSDMEKAAQLMYGFGATEFHDLILLPQARREVAREELDRLNINFDAWLAGAKKKARVHIFLPRMEWDGERVK